MLSTIAGPVGSFLGGPAGAVAGAVASVGLKQWDMEITHGHLEKRHNTDQAQ